MKVWRRNVSLKLLSSLIISDEFGSSSSNVRDVASGGTFPVERTRIDVSSLTMYVIRPATSFVGTPIHQSAGQARPDNTPASRPPPTRRNLIIDHDRRTRWPKYLEKQHSNSSPDGGTAIFRTTNRVVRLTLVVGIL